jgi:hypothetical protein
MTRPLHFRPAPPRPDLTVTQILDWADTFMARFGRWPARKDGTHCLPDTTWSAVNTSLMHGYRGLNPGSSLAKLLLKHRGRRHQKYLPRLTPNLILTWADAHHARTGEWPGKFTGPVAAAPGETWCGVDAALARGLRGLPGGSSFAQFLAAHRGVRNHLALPPFTPEQILGWVDAHRARTGKWPTPKSGPIPEAPGETWSAVESALTAGQRGLPSGGSLPRLLDTGRGVRNRGAVPRLERWEILIWADAYRDRTGRWPNAFSGPIPEAPGETWRAVDSALSNGSRGLTGGDSLSRLLSRRRGTRNGRALPPLSTKQILNWADKHHSRSGKWPGQRSGAIPEAAGETWGGVNDALRRGQRGLPGGSSLAQLFEAARGVRNSAAPPPLTDELILRWADAHHTRTGKWPTVTSGPVTDSPGEKWSAVNTALLVGCRGLLKGSTLTQLLAKHRGKRNSRALPPYTIRQILAWADAHHTRTGAWPSVKSVPIQDAPGETWSAVNAALTAGLRGLRGGDTLARLLARQRGTRNPAAVPGLSIEQIWGWVRAYFRRTGRWPRRKDGPIPEAPGETWLKVNQALYSGQRGLPGGSSLAQVGQECQATKPTNAGPSARSGRRVTRPR